MLQAIIRFALRERLLLLAAVAGVVLFGLLRIPQLPIDVFPDITRPRVAIITECPGVAPEEVEMLVTMPLEIALSGTPGVEAIRSTTDMGLSVIQVEFAWDQDVYRGRQIVQERISGVETPYEPKLAPNSTLLGQIMMIGMWSKQGQTPPLELRTLADWTVKRRLQQISGVAQVIVMGGERQQFQILIDPHQLHQFEVSVEEVQRALTAGNLNVSGGYFTASGQEVVMRGIGRVQDVGEIEQLVVKPQATRSVLIHDVARVVRGSQIKRGDAAVNGQPAVVLTVQKQPNADTQQLTAAINKALVDMQQTLPGDVALETTYEQREFIEYSVHNVIEAIRDGGILVVIVLWLFLMNVRTTLITLTAIPLSLLATGLVFMGFGMTINVMTLGGIAVALGELVDDAIVDIENIFKRLRQNALLEEPQPMLAVIAEASMEVRHAIINSTVIVILVFLPLFFLSGIEGRLFTPLAIAYIVSILASTAVSLTVTPVLASYLLPRQLGDQADRDSWVLRQCKKLVRPVVAFSLSRVGFSAAIVGLTIAVMISGLLIWRMGKNFLPEFDEGASQVNVFLPAGASLASSRETSRLIDQQLRPLLATEQNPEGIIRAITCKNGRAEDDEHVMGVNVSEFTLSLRLGQGLKKDALAEELYRRLEGIPGAEIEVEQPIEHLIGHMLSGVNAEIGIKIYGPDLGLLRRTAEQIRAELQSVPGISPPVIDQQKLVRQLRVTRRLDKCAQYGLTAEQIHRLIESAFQGSVVSQVIDDQRVFDVLVIFDEPWRNDLENLSRLPIEIPNGPRLPLSEVADIEYAWGPNSIKRDNSQRMISIRINTMGRDLSSAVAEIEQKIAALEIPTGYIVELGGQFQAQQSASRAIGLFSLIAFAGICLVLYASFQSWNIVMQILVAIPAGFVGGVLALTIAGESLSISALVGFISLGGIAVRNGILLIEAYRRRQAELPEGTVDWTAAIIQGNLDRLAPVLMTTLTTGIALLPLVVGGTQPGKEVLYPVALVIVGGLLSSTIVEFLVRPGLYRFSRHQ